MRAWTHLFGSTDGYRTLARSPALSDVEDSALSSLGFGSPRTEEEFEQLDHGLCMAGRILPSGRYAITRVFQGAPDVVGRRTIERRTLVLEASDWAQLAAADLQNTLSSPESWRREAFMSGAAVDLRILAPLAATLGATDADRRACDALLVARETGRCAILPDSPEWALAVLRLPGFLPAAQVIAMGWGVGLWAVPAGVWITTSRVEASARNSFTAPTSGPWRHPEQVMRLARSTLSLVPTEPVPMRPRRRIVARNRMPLLAAAFAMAIASMLIWWATQERAARRTSAPESRAQTALTSSALAPRSTTATVSEPDAASPPDPAPSTAPAKPDPSAAPAVPAASSDGSSAGFGGAAGSPAPDAFGSGASDPMSAATTEPRPAPREPTQESSQPATEATSPTPATPVEKPNIPDVPAATTPWDPQVALATQAIALREASRSAQTKENGATLVGKLGALADSLLRSHKEVDANARGTAPAERCLILIDARSGKRGITDTIRREHLSATFSPLLIQRMLLLCARFEISLSIQDLESRGLIDMGALPRSLRGDVKANGWPDDTPWTLWYFRNRDATVSTAADGARFMASQFDAALDGQQGTRNAQEILERLAKRVPSEEKP
jgi:hypothetical protein